MDKLDGKTLDIEKTEKEKLKSIFPQCFVEGKLDTTKLLELVGEYDIKDYEKYEFTWHGKSECIKNAQTRSHGTLRPCNKESKNFDETENLYIEGDNLEVLKLLQKSYYGKVKMIYIDPPYNTGNDFVYKDNFKDNIKNYKEITSQTTKSNSETMGRFHTDWLNMMYPRLRLSYNLLKDDGVIFISIDDNEVHNLRKLCDEIFGEENFVGQVTVVGNPRGRDYGGVARMHDYILCYQKSNKLSLGRIADENRKFNSFDEIGGFELRELRNRNIKFNDKNRPNLYYPFYVNVNSVDENDLYEISLDYHEGYFEVYPAISQGVNTVWRWGKHKSLENINTNIKAKKMINGKYMIVEKYREMKVMARSVWWDKISNTESGTLTVKELFNAKPFDYPKPHKMIKRMCEMATSKNDLILDFFSGSSTTAHAVMELNKEDGENRKFIMVQLPEPTDVKSEAYKCGYKNICEIGKERIRRAGTKINEESPDVDTGFKVLKLDSTNLKIWDNTPIEDEKQLQIDALINRMNEMVDKVKEDRTNLDVVYEILLKLGYELTENVRSFDFSGKKGYVVADGELVVCLDSDVSVDSVEEMIKVKPNTIVFAEDSFSSTEDITNAKLIVGKVLGTENSESIKFKFV